MNGLTPAITSFGSPSPVAAAARLLRKRAFRQVPADSIAAFRIGIGLLISFGSIRFLANGWVSTLYLEPTNHLTYSGFGFVRPLPAPLMYLVFCLLVILGGCIAVGYRHRLATALFVLSFGYTELIEASLYLNHYWFLTAAAVLLFLLPVNHHWSLDALHGRVRPSATIPAVVLWVVRAQIGAVYLFAGIAKLNTDWLLHAQPLQLWFADRTATPIVGILFESPLTAYVASWSAALFDLTIVGWLLWSRSRWLAYVTLVVFHVATGLLFQIGLFPVVMIMATSVFFAADWPNRHGALAWPTPPRPLRRSNQNPGYYSDSDSDSGPTLSALTVAAVVLFFLVQLSLPFRHFAYPSNVRWSEEGYYLSWRVMLTDKAGQVEYMVTDPDTERTWEVDPSLVLTDWQQTHAATRPDLIHATAKLIAGHYAELGIRGVEVRAVAIVSMNGRKAMPIVDPSVDLAAEPRSLRPSPWILAEVEHDG